METWVTLLLAVLAVLAIGVLAIGVLAIGLVACGPFYLLFRFLLWTTESIGSKEGSEDESTQQTFLSDLVEGHLELQKELAKLSAQLEKSESNEENWQETEKKLLRFEREFEALGTALDSKERELAKMSGPLQTSMQRKKIELEGLIQGFERLLSSAMALAGDLSASARERFKPRVNELFNQRLSEARTALRSAETQQPVGSKPETELVRLVELGARLDADRRTPFDGHIRRLSKIDPRGVAIHLVDEAMRDAGCSNTTEREQHIEALLSLVGVKLLNPPRGTQVVASEHNLVAEEKFPGLTRGAVVSVRSPGFRDRSGKLIRKADVVMAR